MRPITSLLWAGTASIALAAAAQAQPADDTIVVGLSADITTFEPANISSRDNANIARHIFGTLYTISGDGEVTPDLAENLEISEDGLNYVYTLREGLSATTARR
jgi:peptide/nickel transport system substrate-binding protein